MPIGDDAMIRFSCADYTFPLLPPAKRFALLKLLGFKYVDVGLFERSVGLAPSQLVADPKNFTRQLKSELQHASLQASDVFFQTGLNPADSATNDPSLHVRARSRKTFMLVLDLCAALNCTHLTGLPGVWHTDAERTDDLALAVDEARWRQRTAADAGVSYAIEPHMGSICPDIASTQSFVESVPGLTLTLDYGHFVFANIDSRDIHSLLPLASHVHVRGGAPGRLQTPVHENKIDFRGMIRRLSKQKYNGFLALEYVWIDWQQCNRADNVSETILLRDLLTDLMKPRDAPQFRAGGSR
jgi:sugar phosphate isomerase/epimerase